MKYYYTFEEYITQFPNKNVMDDVDRCIFLYFFILICYKEINHANIDKQYPDIPYGNLVFIGAFKCTISNIHR